MRFNTGRGYTPEGQIIECSIVGESVCKIFGDKLLTVRFDDLSRGITGYVDVESMTEDNVMRSYDAGNYTESAV